jgi:YVTN family beta-propeller protein
VPVDASYIEGMLVMRQLPRLAPVVAVLLTLVLLAGGFGPTPVRASTVLLGGVFNFLVVDNARSRVYVSNANGSVGVIDSNTDAVLAWIPVGSGPTSMDLAFNESELFVSVTGSDVLAVINLTTDRVVRSFHLPFSPGDLAAGRPGRAYVSSWSSWSYPEIVDTDTGRVVGAITAAGSYDQDPVARISRDRRTLFLSERLVAPTNVSAVSVVTDRPVFIGGTPWGSDSVNDAYVSPDGSRYYYPNPAAYYVVVYSTSNWSSLPSLNTGPYPYSVCLSDFGQLAFATAESQNTLWAFNATNGTLRTTFPLSGDPRYVRSLENGTKAYVITSSGLEVVPTGFPAYRYPIPAPVAVANTTKGFAPLSVAFYSSVMGGEPPYNVTWTFGDGATAYVPDPTHVYATPGSYTATLRVRDVHLFNGSQKLGITAVPVPPPTILSASANVSWGDAPLNVAFTATVTGGIPPFNFTWSFGDGGTAYAEDPTHVFTKVGSYLAAFVVTDTRGLSATQNLIIVVTTAPGPNPLRVAATFGGASYDPTTNPWAPPDPQVAAGVDHVVEMVNLRYVIWARAGTEVKNGDLASFFGVPPHERLTDPRVVFDPLSQRWFASIADFNRSTVLLAVSSSQDPTLPWHVQPFLSFSGCPDQPFLGTSSSVVVLSDNGFTSCTSSATFMGAEYWVINKTELLLGQTPSFAHVGPDPNLQSVFPAESETSSPTMFLVSVGWAWTPTDTLTLFRISGVPPGKLTFANETLSVRTIVQPPNAVQSGTSWLVNTGDARVQDAFWRDGHLWVSLGDACFAAGTPVNRSCGRILETDTSNGTVLQDFEVGNKNQDSFYPAIAVDGSGDLIVSYGFSSATADPGVLVAAQLAGDAPNTTRAPLLVQRGVGPSTQVCPDTSCRFGDYFGASPDPVDPSAIWIAGEYGDTTGWNTVVAEVGAFRVISLTLSYRIVGGGTLTPTPAFAFFSNGRPENVTLSTTPQTFRVDEGTPWLLTPAELVAAPERWIMPTPFSGVATTAATEVFVYQHQFEVSVLASPLAGGTVSVSSGWYDADAVVPMTATATAGWKLVRWQGTGIGSYSGSAPTANVAVSSAVGETAVFYPGLTLAAGAGGSVSFTDGNVSGTVSPGSSTTLYIPLGAVVRLIATGDLLDTFTGWKGSQSGSDPAATVTMNGPETVQAVFALGLPFVLLVVVLPVALAVIAVALVLFLRSRRKAGTRHEPPSPPPPSPDSASSQTPGPPGRPPA